MERMVFVYRGEGGPEEIVVERRGSTCAVTQGGRQERGELVLLGDGRLSIVLEDGRQVCGRVGDGGGGIVTVSARELIVE